MTIFTAIQDVFRFSPNQSSEPSLGEYQIKSEVENENSDDEVKETKFLNRLSTFHQSFAGKLSVSRTKKTRQHTVNGTKGRLYGTRANISRGNSRTEPSVKQRSINHNREQRNQAQVRKVQVHLDLFFSILLITLGCPNVGDSGDCLHLLLDPDTHL